MCVAQAQSELLLVYPPNNHQTTSEQIFFIGTSAPNAPVFINNQPVERSKSGHFAPTFPLQMGDNLFTIRSSNQEIQLTVTRLPNQPLPPVDLAFAENSLTPSVSLSRLPGESICFSVIAPNNANVLVSVGEKNIPLFPQEITAQLPQNSSILVSKNKPLDAPLITQYQGCSTFEKVGSLGAPVFKLMLNNQTITQRQTEKIEILSPDNLEVIEVIADVGVTRTGPSADYSRLTPLPKGTRATVTGKEGDWLRLDYGAWILKQETRVLPNSITPKSTIRGISSRQVTGATEIMFPLQVPVPVSVIQEDNKFTLTLHNTRAQTDTIYLGDDPLIKRLDWQQVTPDKIEYSFVLKTEQQWGYDLRYEGTTLILTLRHPPKLKNKSSNSLRGITILLDPGHGGQESGAKGPTGYPEKDVNLTVAKLLQRELIKRGATVYMTRETDKDVSLKERVEQINQLKPTLSLSIHYNALPDNGDAINTKGIGTFWYHPQAHDLAIFLHNYLVAKLDRPSYGVFWNNLALTRPHSSPSVLLELGFMINPDEFDWITNSQEQIKLARGIADGISAWLETKN